MRCLSGVHRLGVIIIDWLIKALIIKNQNSYRFEILYLIEKVMLIFLTCNGIQVKPEVTKKKILVNEGVKPIDIYRRL